MIRAGRRAGARTHRIAFRDLCESPICIRRGVSPQLLQSRLTTVAATATHSRLEPLLSPGFRLTTTTTTSRQGFSFYVAHVLQNVCNGAGEPAIGLINEIFLVRS